MSKACSTNGRGEEERIWDIDWKAMRKGTTRKRKRRWVGNTKMDLEEIKWGCVRWTDLVQDGDLWRALVNTVLNLRAP
jgi:hypothetical protein